ncbi:MAG: dTDP-4-amino-4,6-dideoxygalactose transaminase, partial [Planctomycetota bacterium]
FPIAEALCEEVLCLPVHPFLTEEDVDRVIAALTEILN